MISVRLQGKPLNMIVYAPTTNAEEAEVEGFYEELQDLLELTPKEMPFSSSVQFGSVAQSCLTLCNAWTAACQTSLSITNSKSLLKLMSIDSVMPPSHLILCCPLLRLPPIPPSIRVFSSESVLCMRWPKYWSFSFSIIPK